MEVLDLGTFEPTSVCPNTSFALQCSGHSRPQEHCTFHPPVRESIVICFNVCCVYRASPVSPSLFMESGCVRARRVWFFFILPKSENGHCVFLLRINVFFFLYFPHSSFSSNSSIVYISRGEEKKKFQTPERDRKYASHMRR